MRLTSVGLWTSSPISLPMTAVSALSTP
jgi:hypothetical protein